MAEYRIVVPIDPAPAKAGSASVKQELRGIQNEAKATGKAVNDAFGPQSFGQSIDALNAKLDTLAKGITVTATAGDDLIKSNSAIIASLDRLTAATERANQPKSRPPVHDNDDYQASLRRVLAAVDETAAAQLRANAILEEARKLYGAGKISLDQLTRAEKLAADAGKQHVVSVRAVQQAQLQAGQQFQDFAQQVSLGINPVTAFTQQAGQMAFAMSNMEGAAKKVGTFLSTGFGTLVLVGISVVGQLISSLISTKEEANEAEKAADKFGTTTGAIQNIIDTTTGKLLSQASAYALVARNAAAADLAKKQEAATASRDKAFGAAEKYGRIGSSLLSVGLVSAGGADASFGSDSDVARIVKQAKNTNASAAELSAALDELARRKPSVKAVADEVREAAKASLEFDAAQKELNGRIKDYDTLLSGGAINTTAMIERRVRDKIATTELEKAQAALNDVRARAGAIDRMEAGAPKDAALRVYERDLRAAEQAVKDETQAKKDSRKAQVEANKERREAEKELRKEKKALDDLNEAVNKASQIDIYKFKIDTRYGEIDFDKANKSALDEAKGGERDNRYDLTRQSREQEKRIGADYGVQDQQELEDQQNQERTLIEKFHEWGIISEQEYQRRLSEIKRAALRSQLSDARSIADSLTQIAEDSVGKQSGVYKTLFTISKAFAIADSIVQIQGAIAKALNTPFPANLGAVAVVAAQAASIIANIKAVALNFADGGLVRGPGGPRDDKVQVNASNGEYIVNAAAVQRGDNLALLEALNSGRITSGMRAVANNNAPQASQQSNGGGSMSFQFGDIIVQGARSAEDGEEIGDRVKAKLERMVDERIAAAQRPGGALRQTRSSVMA